MASSINILTKSILLACLLFTSVYRVQAQVTSAWVSYDKDNMLSYKKDSVGNSIPNFSAVGYHYGISAFPKGTVVATLSPSGGDDTYPLQQIIETVSHLSGTPNEPKVILLKKGHYTISSTININAGNVVIRGEGSNEDGTVITYTATKQSDLFHISGTGKVEKIGRKAQPITDAFVPVGDTQFHVRNASAFAINQPVIITRTATPDWIHTLRMDSIANLREGGKNWEAKDYELNYERIITAIDNTTGLVTINAPIVMTMDERNGAGSIVPYTFEGRISEVGMENMRLVSTYSSDTDEQHGWAAIEVKAAEHCWVQNVVSVHFGYSCVHLGASAKNISVQDCTCLDAISIITGGRRYSFNCDGQLNLFRNCTARNGRHDFVTGGRVCGPNVFVYCNATLTHADIGPHHRWATGTLYDNVTSDGAINAQDRGNWGTGHGWSGAGTGPGQAGGFSTMNCSASPSH